jgi:hypothetical protein
MQDVICLVVHGFLDVRVVLVDITSCCLQNKRGSVLTSYSCVYILVLIHVSHRCYQYLHHLCQCLRHYFYHLITRQCHIVHPAVQIFASCIYFQ